MRYWLAVLLVLTATPAMAQQQIMCVPDTAAADEAAQNSGEELAWQGKTSSGVEMRFYLGRDTWTVFFYRSDRLWCTTSGMVGEIKRADAA